MSDNDVCRALWLGVILEAKNCLQAPKTAGKTSRDYEIERDRHRARRFFQRVPSSRLDWICEHLGLDPARVSKKALEKDRRA